MKRLAFCGIVFLSCHAMEDPHASKLLPDMVISKEARKLIEMHEVLQRNGHLMDVVKKYSLLELEQARSLAVFISGSLVTRPHRSIAGLFPHDFRYIMGHPVVIQAWLYSLPGKERDENVERLFLQSVRDGHNEILQLLVDCKLQTHCFETGFLETLAKIADHNHQSEQSDYLRSLRNLKNSVAP